MVTRAGQHSLGFSWERGDEMTTDYVFHVRIVGMYMFVSCDMRCDSFFC